MMRMKKGEKEKESSKRAGHPKARQTLGKFSEVALSPFATGADLVECQCCSRRITKKSASGDENATRSADQRKHFEGKSTQKVEAAIRRGQK